MGRELNQYMSFLIDVRDALVYQRILRILWTQRGNKERQLKFLRKEGLENLTLRALKARGAGRK